MNHKNKEFNDAYIWQPAGRPGGKHAAI